MLEKQGGFGIICPVAGEGKTIIAVIGGRDAGSELFDEARRAGRLLARAGVMVLTGGLEGIMEAASRGAKEEGGLTVGVLPGDQRGGANPHVDVPIATGLGIGRNVIIARTADGVLAVGGAYGTLSEIAFSLQLGKPVVGIGTWDIEGVHEAENAEAAVEKLLSLIERP
jgi:uncharacterized protein (TIGR00725 family)